MNLVIFNNTWPLKDSMINEKIKRLLDRSQKFDMLEGKKISAMLPRSLKKSFKNGVIIPVQLRHSNECNDKLLCTTCNNQVNENKEVEANSNLLSS